MTRESREAREERKLAKKEKDIEHEGIVGRDIQPIDGEIPLREYEVARYHNYLRGLIAKGYLEITNKRLIYQVTGQSVYGPVLYHSEYAVDKVIGFNISRGGRVSYPRLVLALALFSWTFPLLGMVLLSPFSDAGTQLVYYLNVIIAVVAIIAALLLRRHAFIGVMLCGLAMGASLLAGGAAGIKLLVESGFNFAGFDVVAPLLLVLSMLAMVLLCIAFSMVPGVAINILVTDAGGSAMSLQNKRMFTMDNASRVLYGRDADTAVVELGAIIDDLRTSEDAAVRKWRSGGAGSRTSDESSEMKSV